MDIIAFDCFDTLLHRDCHPEVVLFSWAREMSACLKFAISGENLYDIRKEAEKTLKKIREDISYNKLLGTIYEKICAENNSLPISKKEFIDLSYNIEQNIEMDHLFLDNDNVSLLKEKYAQGNYIIVVTDFYLPKKFFEYIFHHFGILDYVNNIFVSCEIGKRKSTGNLYKYILNLYPVSPNHFTMIGDNRESDDTIPRTLGIKTILVPYDSKLTINKRAPLKKNVMQLTKTTQNNIFSGYSAALYLFCERLYVEAKKNDISVLLFCSREGQNLKEMFDIYQNTLYPHNLILTKYLYVSRRSTLLPSLKDFKDEKFERIFRQYHELIVKDFLKSIGFENSEIDDLHKAGVDINSIVSKQNLSQMAQYDLLVDLYNKKRKSQRILIKKYLKQLNNGNNETIFLVDIGWKGTIQDNIYEIYDREIKIAGFYFGLFKCISTSTNSKKGLMFEESSNSNFYNIYSNNYVDLEKVFAADHGPTVCYVQKNNMAEPNISNKYEDIEIYQFINDWQRAMNSSFKMLCQEFFKSKISSESISQTIAKSYLRTQCIFRPKHDKIYLEFRKKAKENFGNISGTKLKAEGSYIRDKIMKKDYFYVEYSYRILNKFHLYFLYPFANMYCHFVYFIKKLMIIR